MQVRINGNGGNRWRAPQAGFVKVNFDGAVFGDSNKSDEIEALATLKALTFAHKLGFQNVILEGDALGLIQALKSQEQNLYPLGLLVEDVKVYLNHFSRVLYSHVKRNGNSVAHNLAKHAISILDFQV
ncbi:hypothetical protein SO802_015417 [Lithocarpus litseifolius]|uniref:RNase H type-1 domain-containing protein n=1 Tax=Lithocarpus litseifolius TaxID=425828 RepID=A0AAW2CX92_9ROSI